MQAHVSKWVCFLYVPVIGSPEGGTLGRCGDFVIIIPPALWVIFFQQSSQYFGKAITQQDLLKPGMSTSLQHYLSLQ